MTTMYDSTNPFDIPLTAEMVGGYDNGIYFWPAAGWARFQGTPQRHIVVSAINAGDTLDVERGDAFPWEAPGWCQQRRAAGVTDLWVYVQLSTWAATRTEFVLRGVPEPLWWIADYDGDPTIPAGAMAKQYANQAIIPGNPHYDLSNVLGTHGGGGGIITESEDEMQKVVIGINAPAGYVDPSGPNAQYVTNWITKRYIATPEEAQDLLALLGQTAPQQVNQGTLDRIPRIAPVPLDNPGAPPVLPVTVSAPPEPVEPKTITLAIPSVPGTATGTIS